MMSEKEFMINDLATNAEVMFGVKKATVLPYAKKYVDNGNVPFDDPMVCHGIIDHYVMDLLFKAHLLTKKQIIKRA